MHLFFFFLFALVSLGNEKRKFEAKWRQVFCICNYQIGSGRVSNCLRKITCQMISMPHIHNRLVANSLLCFFSSSSFFVQITSLSLGGETSPKKNSTTTQTFVTPLAVKPRRDAGMAHTMFSAFWLPPFSGGGGGS